MDAADDAFPPRIGDPDRLAEAFRGALADTSFPADRDQLLAAVTEADAGPEVVGLVEGLDDTAPFASVDAAWAETAGPDGS